MLSHTSELKKAVAACRSVVETVPIPVYPVAWIIGLLFIWTVDMAGSIAQSAMVERDELVAMGIPLSKSSLLADVRMLPSKIIPRVLMDEHAMSWP
jgi:hypothetical protein